jgi:polyphosphate kinase 2 (PPK2 family)
LTLDNLTPHERSVLGEQKVELEHGVFRISKQFQMYRLEDRLLFLCHRFSKKSPLDRRAIYWGNFKEALDLRNDLTHPKTAPPTVTEASVERALLSILQLLDTVYKRIYNKRYPRHSRGLESNVAV